MKLLLPLCLAAACLLIPASIPTGQAAVEALEFGALCERSPLIVRGFVEDSTTTWARDARGEVIVTNHGIRIDEVLKGRVLGNGKKLTLQCVGGRIDDTMMLSAVEPSVKRGESVVLFLWPHPEAEGGVYKSYGGFQGKFSLLGDRVREARDQSWSAFKKRIQKELRRGSKKEQGR